MNPEEDESYITYTYGDIGFRFYCKVCGDEFEDEHEVLTERSIAGTTFDYCLNGGGYIEHLGKHVRERSRDISDADLDYVKKSLGVT